MTVKLDDIELAIIEKKVEDFRQRLINAAIKQASRNPRRRILNTIEEQIAVCERIIAGEKYKHIAASLSCHPSSLSDKVHDIVRDQMQYINFESHDDEWHRCLYASSREFRTNWIPLALKRLHIAATEAKNIKRETELVPLKN